MNAVNIGDAIELLNELQYLVWNDNASHLVSFDSDADLRLKENLIPSSEVSCLVFWI